MKAKLIPPGENDCLTGSVTTDTAVPFDQSAFLKNFRGMENVAHDAILSFVNTLPELISAIEKAISDKNFYNVEIAAHTVKGALSVFYAEPSRLLAAQLEQLASGKSLAGAEQIFSQLKIELNKLQTALLEVVTVSDVS